MAVKFFNILDYLTFSAMSESEQKALLIESNIYKKGKSIKVDFSLEEGEIWRGSNNYPKYLGQDFEIKGIDYKLNEDFLNEVFKECVQYIKFQQAPIIENNLETIKLQAEFSGDSFISEMLNNEIKNYNNYLQKKLFKKLHYSDFENEEQHFDILKSFLSINWFDLSDYLFGLNNIQSYHIVSNYYSYLRHSRILSLLNSKKEIDEAFEIDNQKFSRPKFIAMLHELGFFKWESIKDLSNDQKAKIILALLQQDYNSKNATHNVVKNFQALNPQSELNPKKFTAVTHVEDVKKTINAISKKL
jgi:hypothetical protein